MKRRAQVATMLLVAVLTINIGGCLNCLSYEDKGTIEELKQLKQFENRIFRVYRKTIPSVVEIRLYKKLSVAAAGVIIDDKGHILTNAHVGREVRRQLRLRKIYIKTWDGKSIQIDSCVLSDSWTGDLGGDIDLAIIKVDPKKLKSYPVIEFGYMANLKVGNILLAIGHPEGGVFSLSQGVVSRIGPVEGKTRVFIQTDAAINVSFSRGRTKADSGLNFCVPVNVIKKEIPKLLKKLEGEERC